MPKINIAHLVDYCTQEYTVVQPNVEVELTFDADLAVPALGTAHLAQAQALSRVGKRLGYMN